MRMTDTPQFKQGMQVETWLDDYFRARGWAIERASSHEERVLCKGDRHFRRGEQSLWIEYKSGIQTFYTGNVFLETISVDSDCSPGWVYTSQADFVVYATLLNGKILFFKPEDLRRRIGELRKRYPTAATAKGQNEGYKTHGVLVPLRFAESELACKVILI